jgi:hypothetical protein
MTNYKDPSKAKELLDSIQELYDQLYDITEEYEISLRPDSYDNYDYSLLKNMPIKANTTTNRYLVKRFKTRQEANDFIDVYKSEGADYDKSRMDREIY